MERRLGRLGLYLLMLSPMPGQALEAKERIVQALEQLTSEKYDALDWLEHSGATNASEENALAEQLEDCIASLQRLRYAQDKQDLAAANVSASKAQRPSVPEPISDMGERVSREMEPFIALGLVCVTAALLQGRRPLDLFSVDIYSPWEAALAFTLSSLTGYLLVNQWVLGVLPSNPFSLYVAELIMCFLAVTTCVPLLMGSSQASPRWHTLASLVLVICCGALCLADEISRVLLFLTKEPPKEDTSMVIVPCAVVVLLYIGLVGVCTMKVMARLGVKRRAFEPYGTACVQKCKDYVAGRLAGTADAQSGPVPIPAAVLLQVVGVGAVMAMVLLQMGYMAWVQYNALRMLAVAMLRPIEPLFKLAGSPLPADVLDFAMPRIIATFYLAWVCCGVYLIWLMRSVLHGYRRMFREFSLGRRYHGQDLVRAVGPSVFHAQWATYTCGALIGNAAMALVLFMFVLWLLFLVLSLPQFWEAQWALRNWWILYGLLYVTRWSIFRWVIPQRVVTPDGSVLRRRVWDLVFPTLTLLNFVLGATSGVIRSLVIAPYLLIHFFRIDITYLPSDLCDWDWSFQPFVSLVMHSQRRLNPILLATVAELAKKPSQEPPAAPAQLNATVEEEQEMGYMATAVQGGHPLREGLPIPAQCPPTRARTTPGPQSLRARQRWQLALILARNPSLRRLRKGSGRADSAPGCLQRPDVQEEPAEPRQPLMPLQLPGLPPRRLESSNTFWSPLNSWTRARTAMLSDVGGPSPGFSFRWNSIFRQEGLHRQRAQCGAAEKKAG